jgi:hypothetical protein
MVMLKLHSDILIGEYEPDNGTRYTAIAIPWKDENCMMLGSIGTVADGWLVTYCNTGRTHLLQKEGYLTDDYIAEKFVIGPGDILWAGELIRLLVNRPGPLRHIYRDAKDLVL